DSARFIYAVGGRIESFIQALEPEVLGSKVDRREVNQSPARSPPAQRIVHFRVERVKTTRPVSFRHIKRHLIGIGRGEKQMRPLASSVGELDQRLVRQFIGQ